MAFEFSIRVGKGANKENTPTVINPKSQHKFPDFIPVSSLTGIFSGDRFNVNTQTKQGQWSAYNECEAVQSIIDKRSQYMANGRYTINGKPIAEVPTTVPAKKLLTAPSQLTTIGEFENQVNVYRDVFGFCPILKVYATDFSTLPYALYPINPILFEYDLTGKTWGINKVSDYIKEIRYKLDFNQSNYEILRGAEIDSKIYILKGRGTQGKDAYTMQSPLFSCSDIVSNFNAGINVYGNLIKQSIAGIIANKTNDVAQSVNNEGEKDIVQNALRGYGLVSGKDNIIVTNANLVFQSLMTNVSNLQIPAELTISVNALCDRLGFSPELLAEKVGTYENKKAAEVGHYQNETIPTANEYCRMLTEITGQAIGKDFSHIAVLQENKVEKINSFNSLVNGIVSAINAGLMDQSEAMEIIKNYKP